MYPKRCAFARGVQVVSRAEAAARLRAAVDARDALAARGGPRLLVIGRTDSRPAANVDDGLAEALYRCEQCAALGADVVYFEGPRSRDEMRALHRAGRLGGVPTMLAQVERGDPADAVSLDEAADLGYKLVLWGVTLLNANVRATQHALRMMARGEHPRVPEELVPFERLGEAVGFDAYFATEERYRVADSERPPR